ncbi:MAG TPA: transcriptional regulator [candidate division WOR-3 bacterium]|mgnify:CR=1 FL=1|uniref:Transcriptional regulator n=1 Tax=candidate division WOR-3 bacterium TaxID=2052148 RepID=A0A7V0XFR2_UNCW3|nr:transcriptional regulator [candidate division WOR-3 bacterium]
MTQFSQAELVELVDRLRAKPHETEWLEFKGEACAPQRIGEYLSGLANSAALKRKLRGYLVFGVENKTHKVIGTNHNPESEKSNGQPLLLWLTMGLAPRVDLRVTRFEHPDGHVVVFDVEAAHDRPVEFRGTAYVRVSECLTQLREHPEKVRAIWNLRTDWTAQVCERASLDDLDPDAIAMARKQFAEKHPAQVEEAAHWDDEAFLNKAKLAVQGAVTNTAVLLLGRPEAATLLAPAVARISWLLRDDKNQEKDYAHFGTPFILQVDRVLKRIRNLTIRAMPSGTLFPKEISQYDLWVIREALHNCIAHQDYGLAGRINLVETPTTVRLSNMGSFIPGSVERVIGLDAPPEYYRNRFLAEAMVNLNMIDTQGGGIKKMFRTQAGRFFPLPDYDLSQQSRVEVSIEGRILDERYTRLLMERTDLDLTTMMLLDKVQKRNRIPREAHRRLKSDGLVEGRYPNLIVAKPIAQATGQKARHTRDSGFNQQYYLDLVVKLVKEHGPVTRKDIDELLLDKLPGVLSAEQRRSKIHNLLTRLSREGRICNTAGRRYPSWRIATSQDAPEAKGNGT